MTDTETPPSSRSRSRFRMAFLSGDYGMLAVLVALVALFSLLTIGDRQPEGAAAGRQLAKTILNGSEKAPSVFIAGRDAAADQEFAAALSNALGANGATIVDSVLGDPAAVRTALDALRQSNQTVDVLAVSSGSASMPVFNPFVGEGKTATKLLAPSSYKASTFLGTDNLRNVASQIAVIAILAIGMTIVIITAGIDLSVGSLIALAAVSTCYFVREFANGVNATWLGMAICSLAAIGVCALAGAFTGWMVTGFCVPPFIATLAMMLMLRGTAFKLADNQTIDRVPDTFQWLGNGNTLGIPNSVLLMLALYLIAHIVMSQTKLGRYFYAVGGNPEATRLSGVPVKRIKMIAYTISGLLAGIGGVVLASQLKSGAGNYGETYELKVIAAVVVGGASLFGGKGKIFGTLIGAFIIAIIENGMNLKKLGSESQMIVLGGVILTAVILERLRSGEWKSAIGG